MVRPADGTAIVRAAMAFRMADLEFQQADNEDVQGDWREDAQQAYSAARAALMALCDTRLRPIDGRP